MPKLVASSGVILTYDAGTNELTASVDPASVPAGPKGDAGNQGPAGPSVGEKISFNANGPAYWPAIDAVSIPLAPVVYGDARAGVRLRHQQGRTFQRGDVPAEHGRGQHPAGDALEHGHLGRGFVQDGLMSNVLMVFAAGGGGGGSGGTLATPQAEFLFAAGADAQRVYDTGGSSYHGFLGRTSAVEAADPTYSATGLYSPGDRQATHTVPLPTGAFSAYAVFYYAAGQVHGYPEFLSHGMLGGHVRAATDHAVRAVVRGTSGNVTFGTKVIVPDSWNFVMYRIKDGEQVITLNNTVRADVNATAALAYTYTSFGRWFLFRDAYGPFKGTIAEARFYNSFLSDQQVTDIYADAVGRLSTARGISLPAPVGGGGEEEPPPPDPDPEEPPPPSPNPNGLQGFGSSTTGGGGGQTIYVTNLNDSGAGSLRAALATTGVRTVKFQVSGTITLASRLSIQAAHSNLTLTGADAPGRVTLVGNGAGEPLMALSAGAHDIIIQHLRFRKGPGGGNDNLQMNGSLGKIYNVVVDHCSLSYSTDENINTYDAVENITFSWCIVSEPLHNSTHPDGPHGKNGAMGKYFTANQSFHHCLFMSAHDRSLQINQHSGLFGYINNVHYNNYDETNITRLTTDEIYKGDIRGNYWKVGPNSVINGVDRPNLRTNGVACYVADSIFATQAGVETYHAAWGAMTGSTSLQLAAPVSPNAITITSPQQAYIDVLAGAGATLPSRDAIDARLVNEVKTGTGSFKDTVPA